MLRGRARRMVVGAAAVVVVAGLTGPASIATAQLQAPEADTVELNTVSAFGAWSWAEAMDAGPVNPATTSTATAPTTTRRARLRSMRRPSIQGHYPRT